MRVNKNTVIKVALECGLQPIETTWDVTRKTEHNRYFGSDVFTNYELKFLDGIYLYGDKYSNANPDFQISYSKKAQRESVKKFVEVLQSLGYDITANVFSTFNAQIKKDIQLSIEVCPFEEDLIAIKNFIEKLKENDPK